MPLRLGLPVPDNERGSGVCGELFGSEEEGVHVPENKWDGDLDK